MASKEKGVDFWSLLKVVNDYDTWLRDRLCSFGTDYEHMPIEYQVTLECREKLQEFINRYAQG